MSFVKLPLSFCVQALCKISPLLHIARKTIPVSTCSALTELVPCCHKYMPGAPGRNPALKGKKILLLFGNFLMGHFNRMSKMFQVFVKLNKLKSTLVISFFVWMLCVYKYVLCNRQWNCGWTYHELRMAGFRNEKTPV